jgi:uncharacterized CHY-type Zn-finger protein
MSEECSTCGEENEKLYMHSRCHTDIPTWAILDKEKSELEIICAKCEKTITKFKVLRVIK